LDVALLPIGATYTMDIDEAIEAAEIIRPKLAVPMHTRAIADPHEFVSKIQKRLPQVKAIAPGIGEPFVIA
jgi:L-ascorbate metabolism protein UlaG (beta-lactamase superfamily)